MGGVDPAIESPTEVIDDGMGVAGAEAGIEFGAFVGGVVAIGVFEEPDIRRGGNDDSVFVKYEAGSEFEFVGEDMLFVHQAVAIGVRKDADAVEGVAVVVSGFDGAAVLPDIGVGFAEAVGILGGFDNPHASFLVPVEVHRLVR